MNNLLTESGLGRRVECASRVPPLASACRRRGASAGHQGLQRGGASGSVDARGCREPVHRSAGGVRGLGVRLREGHRPFRSGPGHGQVHGRRRPEGGLRLRHRPEGDAVLAQGPPPGRIPPAAEGQGGGGRTGHRRPTLRKLRRRDRQSPARAASPSDSDERWLSRWRSRGRQG